MSVCKRSSFLPHRRPKILAHSNRQTFLESFSKELKCQMDVARELEKEIATLRAENSELKFQLYIRCPDAVVKHSERCPPAADLKAFINTPKTEERRRNSKSLSQKKSAETAAEVKRLESAKEKERLQIELEASRRLIDDLKWTNDHFKSKVNLYEHKIQHLQKENTMLKSNGLEIFQFQIPVGNQCQFYSRNLAPSTVASGHRRRRSVSAGRSSELQRRPSLQSLLPDNYKDSVASLPPIANQSESLIFSPGPGVLFHHDGIEMDNASAKEISRKLKLMSTPQFHVGSKYTSTKGNHSIKLPMKTPTLLHYTSK